MNLCACGCGKPVKPNRKFLWGHNSKGRRLSTITRKKLSNIHKGRTLSVETRKKIGDATRKRIKEQGHHMLGKHHTKEAKRKISEGNKGKSGWNTGRTAKDHPSVLGGSDAYWFGKKLSEEHKAKMSKAAKTEKRIKIAISHLPKNQIGENHPMYGKHHTKEAKQKMREARRGQNFPRNKTKPELELLKIIDKHKLPIKYVGDGSYWVGRINPDFIAVNDKLAIEVFGDYWHDPARNPNVDYLRTEEGRREYLKSLGWDLIVLWQSEMEGGEEFILSKLNHQGLNIEELDYIIETFRELG